MIPLDLPPLLALHAHPLRVEQTVRVHPIHWKNATSPLQNVSFCTFLTSLLCRVIRNAVRVDNVAEKGWGSTLNIGCEDVSIFALLTGDLLVVFETVWEKES